MLKITTSFNSKKQNKIDTSEESKGLNKLVTRAGTPTNSFDSNYADFSWTACLLLQETS